LIADPREKTHADSCTPVDGHQSGKPKTEEAMKVGKVVAAVVALVLGGVVIGSTSAAAAAATVPTSSLASSTSTSPDGGMPYS